MHMNALIALRNPSPIARKYFYVGGNGKRGYLSFMRGYGIFLIILNALLSLFWT